MIGKATPREIAEWVENATDERLDRLDPSDRKDVLNALYVRYESLTQIEADQYHNYDDGKTIRNKLVDLENCRYLIKRVSDAAQKHAPEKNDSALTTQHEIAPATYNTTAEDPAGKVFHLQNVREELQKKLETMQAEIKAIQGEIEAVTEEIKSELDKAGISERPDGKAEPPTAKEPARTHKSMEQWKKEIESAKAKDAEAVKPPTKAAKENGAKQYA